MNRMLEKYRALRTEQKKTLQWLAILTAVFLVLTVFSLLIALPLIVKILLFLALYAVVAFPVLAEAVHSVSEKEFFDESVLMALSSLGAFILGKFPEAVAIMLFSRIGEWFEDYATDESRDAVAALVSLCPDTARLYQDGQWKTVSADDVLPGDRVKILAGERVCVDGKILLGVSSVDASALTGESMPCDVLPGDSVYSGSINLTGVLEVEVTHRAEDSAAARILKSVQDAMEHRSSHEGMVKTFSKYYTPAVLIAAVLIALIPSIVTGQWSTWISRGLSFLVVSCPCALVLSVPMSYFSGIGVLSSKGVLVKGSDVLERLAKTESVFFDKTGTLTDGELKVSYSSNDATLMIAALLEQNSNHPIARSLCRACPPNLKIPVTDLTEIPGKGLEGKIGGVRIRVGKEALFEGLKLPELKGSGTKIYVGTKKLVIGGIVLSDTLRDDAGETVYYLRQQGVKHVHILSGDTKESVASIAEQSGIRTYRAGLSPEDKVEYVRQAEHTVFVGDGINDAPVLSAADVGVAMGGLGSDAALESAGVVLMADDLVRLPDAIGIAGQTRKIVLENMLFSIGAKLLILLLCAFGVAGMWLAVFGDVGVLILAVLNALRLLRLRD